MPVEKTDVIDLLTRNPKTNEVMLVMIESRDWNKSPEAIPQLKAKFFGYAEYLLSGAIEQQYPELANGRVLIRLDHFSPINDTVAEVLREWAAKLSGISVGICSHRVYWNPLARLVRGLLGRFSGPTWHIVRWEPGPSSAAPLLTAEQFCQEVVAALRDKMPNLQVQAIDKSELKVMTATGNTSSMFLDNAYDLYRVTPENKDEIIRRYLAVLVDTLTKLDTPIQKDRIVPILKDKAWIQDVGEALRQRGNSKELENIHEDYNEDLVVVYAEDTPNNIHYLTPSGLKQLQLDLKDLRKLACRNLANLVMPVVDIQPDNGIFRVKGGGDYDACLMLLDAFWEAAKLDIAGEPVIAVPARDFFLVTGSENREAVKRMRVLAQTIAAQNPYRLTSKLFIRRDGRFVSYEP